jgi:hypothetical protein
MTDNVDSLITKTKNGYIHPASNLNGKHIANIQLVAHIKQCGELLSADGLFHMSQQSNYIFVPPLREIVSTQTFEKLCSCTNKCFHSNSIRFAGDTPIPTNEKMTNLITVYQQLFHECAETLFALHEWVTLRIPKIEDGNNFGVEVQTQCLDVITKACDSALIISGRNEYYEQRALHYTAMCACPQLEDLKQVC